jgi:2-polyprenyl-6-methoxyphenol hydroxylase-like FAD-dependent oxidoreductase
MSTQSSAKTGPLETEVLIVGGGPTGLMLANQLARRGLRPLIIDRHPGPAQQSRAMAVQARTLEIYAKLGIVERSLELGMRGTAANMWANGRATARIPIGDIGQSLSPFPFVLMLGQDDNERIMGAKLNALGVEVQWNTELVALEQKPHHVDAVLKLPDGSTRAVRAAWVAGCDGARSPVREMSKIGFPGAPYEHAFFVADTEATGPMKQDELNVYMWRDGFHLFFPMRGKNRWRVIGILPDAMRQRDNLTFAEVAPAIRQQAGEAIDFKSCAWFSTYRIHHRAAVRFRDRRCFLLGDAAHVHSPMGAQGMNTGLQDAYNLAWKLALVVQGRADPALLDSYEAERIPVAQRLLETTDRAFQLIVSDGWIARLLRTRIFPRMAAFAMTRERVRKLAFRTISQIGIQYRKSALSRTFAGLPKKAPLAGDRFPWLKLKFAPEGAAEDLYQKLDDTRFTLLVFGQAALSEKSLGALNGMIDVHAIPADAANSAALAAAGIPETSCYLLRPDGHVGLAGLRLDAEAIAQYALQTLRLSGRTEVVPLRKPGMLRAA